MIPMEGYVEVPNDYMRAKSKSTGTYTVTCTSAYQRFLAISFYSAANYDVYLILKNANTSIISDFLLHKGTSADLTLTNTGQYTFTLKVPTNTGVTLMSAEDFTIS